MEPELAQEAVETMQAASVAGAGNEREREKSALLEQMAGGMEIGEVTVVLDEPDGGAQETETVSGIASESANRGETADEDATSDGEASAADQAQAEAARKQARESVASEFPDALKEGTELFEACREELAYLREAQSPLADDPEAEYKIARRMARMLGYSKRAAKESQTAPAKSAAQARRSVRPVPKGGTPVESPATALERRVAGAKSTSEMLELMREIGTPFEALLKR